MEADTDYQPSGIVRMLDTLLRVAQTLLWIGSVLVVGLLILSLTGRGTITVSGVIEAPFSAQLPDGRTVGVDEFGFIASYAEFDLGEEHLLFVGDAELRAPLLIADSDTDSRVVIAIAVAIWIACAWVGLVALRHLFRSTVGGAPFSARSPRWLRQLAAALLLAGVVSQGALIILNRIVDTELPVRIDAGPSPLVLMAAGLGVLVLAELFAEAVRLKDFEKATI